MPREWCVATGWLFHHGTNSEGQSNAPLQWASGDLETDSARMMHEVKQERGLAAPFRQLSRKLRSFRDRLGCFSLRSAFASIWRMRSLVTENCWPTSSSVWSVFMPMPQ